MRLGRFQSTLCGVIPVTDRPRLVAREAKTSRLRGAATPGGITVLSPIWPLLSTNHVQTPTAGQRNTPILSVAPFLAERTRHGFVPGQTEKYVPTVAGS